MQNLEALLLSGTDEAIFESLRLLRRLLARMF